jgi:TetR/AcrR family transcriptional regulator
MVDSAGEETYRPPRDGRAHRQRAGRRGRGGLDRRPDLRGRRPRLRPQGAGRRPDAGDRRRGGDQQGDAHYYFRSKDRLYAQVFQYVFHRFDRAFFEAVELAGESSFRAALATFIDRYIDFVGHHTDILRLMVNEFLSGGEVVKGEIRKLIETTGEAPPQRFARLIARAIERGEIAPVDPRHLLVTVISGCLFPLVALPMVSTLLPEAVTDYEGFLLARRKNLLAVVLRGLEPRSGAAPADPSPDGLPEPPPKEAAPK